MKTIFSLVALLLLTAVAVLSMPNQMGLAAHAVVSTRDFNGVRATSLLLLYVGFLVAVVALFWFMLKDLLRDLPRAWKQFWRGA